LHRSRERRTCVGGSLFSWLRLDHLRPYATGKCEARRIARAPRDVLGLVSICVERVDRQLRFLAPAESGAEHAEDVARFRRPRAKILQGKAAPGDGAAPRARQANRSFAVFSADAARDAGRTSDV